MVVVACFAHVFRVRTCVCAALLWVLGTRVQAADDAAVFGGDVVYSSPKLNDSYHASTEFNPKGVEYLYYMTNTFLDLIQRDDTAALDGQQLETARQAGNLTATFVHLGLHDWPALVQHHIGYAVLAVLGLLIALLTPLVGLIVCCCRCAGRCGGRAPTYDKRGDTCRRWSLGTTLGFFLVIGLLGATGSLLVNERLERGVTEVPARLHAAVDDSQLFVVNTRLEVDHILKDNFEELSQSLDRQLEGCGVQIVAQLAAASRAVAMENLTNIADGLTDIQRELGDLARQSTRLRDKADQLAVGLQDARAELTVLLRSCGTPRCQQLEEHRNLSHLVVLNRFDQLPDIRPEESQVSTLLGAGIQEEVRAGKERLDALAEEIQTEADAAAPDIRRGVQMTGSELAEAATNITSALDRVQLRSAHSAIRMGSEYLQQYGHFRYYLFIVLSALVLLMTICLALGLCCGCCGRRPGNVYGDDACSKGTGASFLVSGAFLYFLLASAPLLLVTCAFLLGGLAQFYFCDALADPSAPGRGLAILQAVYPVQQLIPPLNGTEFDVAQAVSRCHLNQSIYSVLSLEPMYNVSDVAQYKRELGLDVTLEELAQQINVDTDIELLTSRARELLDQLAEANMTHINFTAFEVALEPRITPMSLRPLGQELEVAAAELPPRQRDTATRLRNQAIIVKAQQLVVQGMEKIVAGVKNTTSSLRKRLRYNSTSSVTEAVAVLTENAVRAQLYLRDRGSERVRQLAVSFADEFTSHLDSYSSRVEHAFRHSVGRCGPLSTVYNSTAVTLCSNVLFPFNAYWAALGWCLLLLIPCVILGLALTPLYRKSEPFSEGLMDTDYLYDAYGENENIPLASVRGGGRDRRYRDISRYNRAASPDAPSYASVPPRGRPLLPVGAGGDGTTEPKAPPLWEMPGGPPGYPETLQPGRERPPPYFPSSEA